MKKEVLIDTLEKIMKTGNVGDLEWELYEPLVKVGMLRTGDPTILAEPYCDYQALGFVLKLLKMIE